MTNNSYIKPFLLIAFFFVSLFLYSKFGPNLPLQIISQDKGQPFVVSAEGKSVYTPNEAVVSFGIQSSGQTLTAAQKEVNTKSKTLTDKLKSLGILESDIKTTSYNVYPQQDYTNPTPRITGYNVSVNYEVKIKSLDKLNDILAAATENGANIVGGVSFDTDDATKLQETNKAREDAVSNAKNKAQGLAKAAGVTLGKIINVSEDDNSIRPIPLAAPASLDLKTNSSGSTPQIQPGTGEIDLTVTLTYEVR